MKFKNILFALAIATFAFTGCKTETKKEVPTEKKEIVSTGEMKQLAINISGMTCEVGCAKYIQSKLSKQEGVLDAKVIFNDSIATIKYDGAKTNKASLIALVGGLADGMYKASETSIKSCSQNAKMACCKDKEGKSCSEDAKKGCCKAKDGKACSGEAKMSCATEKGTKRCTKENCKKACCA